ncbi:glycosyltransferase family 4 protein [Vibrio vulnificus]|uniref:glycosyltransferase family 4 protein n=1 Tax=Vibrio vulnificus TaxID=672 RepID=UPI001A2769FA|nr:glycosyltransferase family 4 protein [Vibrio vulnificus]MCG8705365.1 glycosyltransferase family 4 protein [Vibrio vulnificus]HAS8154962.1 glycosyltransferase family 1 protein [Vibrio vulnificus]HAU8285472.1 glycosyltransferase [Vibrio vulnificus]HDY7788686.1 glycosyltransferase family 4 protein [Vibrio vulnificus]HDY8125486.1 glycosyltransferase family 4 protein [Vibrio vulnificus]
MKKLLFVVNVDWFFVSHRLPIALKAIEHGYDVHLACAFSDKKNLLEKYGITCHNIAFSRSGNSLKNELNTIAAIRRVLTEIAPDVVHAVTIKPVIYTGLALKSITRPPAFVAAISGLGYVFTASTLRAKFTKSLVSLMYKFALRSKRKVVIFQNTSDEKILSDIVNLPPRDRTLIKGSGADLSVYNFQPESIAKIKVVSMACRLLKEKGVYQFVEAAKIVKQSYPDTEFWLIGSVDADNPNSVSQQEVDDWVREGLIIALGHRDDIPELFSQSHVITMPSFYGEGVPKVLIEAAACGRPIVTTDNPGCRDAVIDNTTGLVVPIKDSNALANALFSLLSDDDRRMKMGQQARQFAVKEFDVNNVVLRHLDIYDSLMADRL